MITLEKLGKKEKNERGIVLILSLLMLTILSILALSFLTLALHEHNIANNYTAHTQAFYVAEAGLETAKQQLKTTSDWTTLDGLTIDCSAPQKQCQYTFSIPNAELAIVTVASEYRRAKNSQQAGFSKTGLPAPPGGIVSMGLPGTVAFSGNAFTIDGNNWVPPSGGTPAYEDNMACPGSVTVPKFGIAVKDAATQQLIFDGLTGPQQDNVTGDDPGAPFTPTSIGIDNSISSAELLALADTLIGIASETYAPGTSLSSVTLGTAADPKIVVIDATGFGGSPAFTLNASEGAGVLIVKNGALRLAGATKWTGLVILVGENASIDMAGGGDKAIYGSVLIAETVNSTTTIAAGNGNLKVRYSCDGLALANLAAGQLAGFQLWWTEVR